METRILKSLILLLLPAMAAASEVSVSILSLLSPQQMQLTLKTEATLTVTPAGEDPVSKQTLKPGKSLAVEASLGHLILDRSQSLASSIRLICPGGCRTRILTPGMDRHYHGDLHLSARNATLSVVLYSGIEPLTGSILESEMGGGGNAETLQAFAIAVRSFLAAGPRHAGVDFCDTTHCQVFQGQAAGKAASEAVAFTSDVVLAYRGSAFRPYYSRSCGGKTVTYKDVWGEPSPDYPFFNVDCPCALDSRNEWTTRVATEQIAVATGLAHSQLIRNGNGINVVNGAQALRYSIENFRTLLGRTSGWKILPGNRFDVRQEATTWIFTGKGFGHGVGFCQEGSRILGSSGATHHQILRTYFPKTALVRRP